MQIAPTWADQTTGKLRSAGPVLVLVLFAHLIFWQLLRWQNTDVLRSGRHEGNSVVQYLQLSTIRPKPPTIARTETETRPAQVSQITSSVPNPRKRPAASPPRASNNDNLPEAVNTPARQTFDEAISQPGLNLDALRGSALAMERQRKPSEIEQMQASHRRTDSMEKRLGEGVKKAEKTDCLKAYSGIGLLAVIPLAVSTVVDTGCKW